MVVCRRGGRGVGGWVIDSADLESVRAELYPMLALSPEWEGLEDGSPAPNWVAVVALPRNGG